MQSIMLYIFLFFFSSAAAQTSLLKSGPMPGYSSQSEAIIWVQTTEKAKVQVSCWNKNAPGIFFNSDPDSTSEETGYTAKLKLERLQPASRYQYELLINDHKISFRYPLEFQTNSIDYVQDFKVAFGSCAVHTEDESVTHIYESIAAKAPDLMLWLGDNIYMDARDWDSCRNIHREYTLNRSLRQLQPLLASTHHYAIWDDHDYGPDNSDSSFYNKEISREGFKNFWANPSFGIDGRGITTSFSWNDVDFFLLDDRYNRAPGRERNKCKPYLGHAQLSWLLNSLRQSKARFKVIVIGNQVISKMPFEKENYSSYKRERKLLLNQIRENRIDGVFFVSGDRHFSEISRIRRRGSYPLYDFTASPLTSHAITTKFNFNTRRVRNSLIRKRNFALMEFSGQGAGRHMQISYYDNHGNLLYQNMILADCLKNR
jgi:alkaline phosphatase D